MMIGNELMCAWLLIFHPPHSQTFLVTQWKVERGWQWCAHSELLRPPTCWESSKAWGGVRAEPCGAPLSGGAFGQGQGELFHAAGDMIGGTALHPEVVSLIARKKETWPIKVPTELSPTSIQSTCFLWDSPFVSTKCPTNNLVWMSCLDVAASWVS